MVHISSSKEKKKNKEVGRGLGVLHHVTPFLPIA